MEPDKITENRSLRKEESVWYILWEQGRERQI